MPDNLLHIGFTGSSTLGLSSARKEVFAAICTMLTRQGVFHHGDCIKADADAHVVVQQLLGWRVEIHPPDVPTKRAFSKVGAEDVLHPARPYLIRNHDIVDATQVLIAAPDSIYEKQRSGTWATVRYARKLSRPVVLIYPDGSVDIENRPVVARLVQLARGRE